MGVETVALDAPLVTNDTTQINVARSEPIDIGGVIGLAFTSLDGAWTAADIALELSADRATWILATDDTGSVIRMTNIPTAAAWARPIPDVKHLWAFRWMRLVSLNTASTATVNQGSARNVIVSKRYAV